ncbi:MAG: hypothetical protein K2O15_07950 [Lachnospiraceae bacterium]|nr:hypothetical protein [Lachnospiraceae bacterium]
MDNAAWRIEAHIWFGNFDEYAEREKELLELLGRIQGNGSVTVFFRSTPEYIELPGASYDYKDEKKVDELMNFCGMDNVDFVARVSRDAERELGCIRGKAKERN